MDENECDWQLLTFGNTFHAFTNSKADDLASGIMFNQTSCSRAWLFAEQFLNMELQ